MAESSLEKNAALNRLLMRIARRAEKASPEYLTRTFVPIEPVPTMLDTLDNQVIYGRRGTGKTHLLQYIAEKKKAEGDIALYVDLRTIGSSGGLYMDASKPIELRGTHLLVDLVEHVHSQLCDMITSTKIFDDNLDKVIPSLDAIGSSATQVQVVGDTESAITVDSGEEENGETGIEFGIKGTLPSLKAHASSRQKRTKRLKESRKQSGPEVLTVQFGPLNRALASLVRALNGPHVWLLLDEWANVPRDLQPFLAELLRRSFFNVEGISVKICALERQSNFRKIDTANSDYLGIELGADTAASLDLDDFLVFRTDRSHAPIFFQELIYRHISVLMAEMGYAFAIPNSDEFRGITFAGQAFNELVRASEGVPRDALNIAGLAAAIATKNPITWQNVHGAARDYFLRDKEGKISGRAADLLGDIVQDCVMNETREILLKRLGESDDAGIQELYDNRLIHRIQQGVTIGDDYKTKFDRYLVDYGCFIEVLSRGEGRTVSDGLDVPRLVNISGEKWGGYIRLPRGSVNKLASPAKVREVVRGLELRERQRDLSAREKRRLGEARRLLKLWSDE